MKAIIVIDALRWCYIWVSLHYHQRLIGRQIVAHTHTHAQKERERVRQAERENEGKQQKKAKLRLLVTLLVLRPFRSCLSAPMQASLRCCRRSRCQRCAGLRCAALCCMLYKFCVFNCDVDGSKTSLLGNKQRQQRRCPRRQRRSIVSVSVGIHPFSSIALSPHDYFYNTLTHSHDELSAAPEKQT